MPQKLSITAYSTALFSTWVFVEELGLLFDCGDGLTSSLLQKTRKIQHAFISHADRDHLTGLFQFNQLNGRDGLTISYPKDAGSFPAIADFTAKFDPHISGTSWNAIEPGDGVALQNNYHVTAIANGHVESDQTKSLSYVLSHEKRKLKAQFTSLQGSEIASKRAEFGDNALFDAVVDKELIYSGDTPVEFDGRYSGTRILIHESTFLSREELGEGTHDRNLHSSLDAVMEMVAETELQHLILGHFSSRYADAQIDEAVAKEASRCGVNIPISIIYPGRVARFQI